MTFILFVDLIYGFDIGFKIGETSLLINLGIISIGIAKGQIQESEQD